MSPSWRDIVRIGLQPGTIGLARFTRGWRPALSATATLPVQEGGWQAPLEALRLAVADAAWQNARAEVVLSSHYVRYALVPWRDDLSGEEEEQAYARTVLDRTFSNGSMDWDLRLSYDRPGRARVACAIPPGFLDALGETCAAGHLKLASVQPHLMAAFNGVRRGWPAGRCWFALAEPGRLSLGLIRHGEWQSIRSRHATGLPQAGLADAIERELRQPDLMSGTGGPDPVCLATCVAGPAGEVSGDGWQVQMLFEPGAGEAPALSMALAGA